MTRTIRWLLAVLLGVTGWLVGPNVAVSCACGAIITADSTATVYAETATISYFDSVESIDMRLTLTGSAKDAAWIMPVPRGTEISLGAADFESLYKATKPEIRVVEDWWPVIPNIFDRGLSGTPGSEAGVRIVGVQRIGPFDVTTITGTDPRQVGQWLVDHGYEERNDLHETFAHYLGLGYDIVAVKIAPEESELSGDLPSLRMDFTTDEVIYPILLSRHAEVNQGLRLYLVSDHKMQVKQNAERDGQMELRFAGELHKSVLYPTLSFPEDETVYVTLFTATLEPDNVAADYVFEVANNDEPYREYTTVVVKRGGITTVVLLIVGFIGLAVFLRRKSTRWAEVSQP